MNKIDWQTIRRRDFARDKNDPGKTIRYQAEALIYGRCPINLLDCIHCYDEESRQMIVRDASNSAQEITVPITVSPDWYF